MIRPILHVPTGRRFDLATELSADDIGFFTGLRENQRAIEHQLLCETTGGDQRLYVYRTSGGHLMARHFSGGAHEGGHRILGESDEHKRCKEYSARELDRLGIRAATEVSTNNRTRLDVATLDAPRITGIEVQFSAMPDREYKARATRSMRATAFTGKHARPLPGGVLPVWLHPSGVPQGWSYVVPSIAAQDTRWDVTPREGSVAAIGVRSIEAERCRIGSRWPYCPRTRRSHCGSTHPFAALSPGRSLSDVIAQVASAQLVPLRYYTGAIYLVSPEDAARYEELGGQGEYVAGSAGERAMARALGPCLNPGHTAEPPPSPPSPPSPPVTPNPPRCFACGSQDHFTADAHARCYICGSPDHFAVAHQAVRRRREQPSRVPRTGPGYCAGGCGARPAASADYCQSCRMLAKLRQETAGG